MLQEIKKLAKDMQEKASKLGHTIPLSDCQELVTRLAGAQHWHAARAVLTGVSVPEPKDKPIPRVLIIIRGGMAEYACDEGVDVKKFDFDVYEEASAAEKCDMRVPTSFRDLAKPEEVPVEGDDLADIEAFKCVVCGHIDDIEDSISTPAGLVCSTKCKNKAINDAFGSLEGQHIEAEVHSDDRTFEIAFNAVDWFRKASNNEIVDLAGIGWGHDTHADAVAEHFENSNADIKGMFGYLRAIRDTRNACGFECSINEDSAMTWLKQHRPGVWARIVCKAESVRINHHRTEDAYSWDATGGESDHPFLTEEDAAIDAVKKLNL